MLTLQILFGTGIAAIAVLIGAILFHAKETRTMSASTDALTASINGLAASAQTAVTLIGTLAGNADDPATLTALKGTVDATKAALDAVVAANTPPPAPVS